MAGCTLREMASASHRSEVWRVFGESPWLRKLRRRFEPRDPTMFATRRALVAPRLRVFAAGACTPPYHLTYQRAVSTALIKELRAKVQSPPRNHATNSSSPIAPPPPP